VSRRRSSGLIVPIEAARELVAPWLDLVPASSRDLPPHVTVLWPFLPAEALDAAVERELAKLLEGVDAFDLTLTRVSGFTDVAYVEPEPAETLVALTRLLWSEWPECPPFGGAYDEIVPHLTVAVDPTPAQRAAIRTDLAGRLPVAARADAVLLVVEDADGGVRERRRFALGGRGRD
jgi:2'-5' RNA ligase